MLTLQAHGQASPTCLCCPLQLHMRGLAQALSPHSCHCHAMSRKLNAFMPVVNLQAYGRELAEAAEWCNKYRASRKESDLHQAWDLYYHVFKRINKQLPSLTVLELQYVAPALVRAQVSPSLWGGQLKCG